MSTPLLISAEVSILSVVRYTLAEAGSGCSFAIAVSKGLRQNSLLSILMGTEMFYFVIARPT